LKEVGPLLFLIADLGGKVRGLAVRLDIAFGPFVFQYIHVFCESNFSQNSSGLELALPESGA
jgi:hypothetical protein